jgi:predicted ester cyclase
MAIESAAELRELAAAGVAAWNDRRLDDYYASFAPEVLFHGPGTTVVRGVDALRAHYATALTAFPDLAIRTEQIVVDLDAGSMASRQIEVGTHTGDLVTPQGTLPPTGRTMSMSGAIFAIFDEDGLIVEMFEYFDRLAMTEQLLGPG